MVCGIHNSHKRPVKNWAKKSIHGIWGNILKVIPDLQKYGGKSWWYIEIVYGKWDRNSVFARQVVSGDFLASKCPGLFETKEKVILFQSEWILKIWCGLGNGSATNNLSYRSWIGFMGWSLNIYGRRMTIDGIFSSQVMARFLFMISGWLLTKMSHPH